jgi:hypothetical protein
MLRAAAIGEFHAIHGIVMELRRAGDQDMLAAEVNKADEADCTALWFAAKAGCAATVVLLLQCGAAQTPDFLGASPLVVCIQEAGLGRMECVKALVEAAPISAEHECPYDGATAWQWAERLGQEDTLTLFTQCTAWRPRRLWLLLLLH